MRITHIRLEREALVRLKKRKNLSLPRRRPTGKEGRYEKKRAKRRLRWHFEREATVSLFVEKKIGRGRRIRNTGNFKGG